MRCWRDVARRGDDRDDDPRLVVMPILMAGAGDRLTAIEPSLHPYFFELFDAAELGIGDRTAAERWARMAGDAAAAFDLSGRWPSPYALAPSSALADGDAHGAAVAALDAVAVVVTRIHSSVSALGCWSGVPSPRRRSAAI